MKNSRIEMIVQEWDNSVASASLTQTPVRERYEPLPYPLPFPDDFFDYVNDLATAMFERTNVHMLREIVIDHAFYTKYGVKGPFRIQTAVGFVTIRIKEN